ncbi:hypothetical protein AAFP30_27735 [Gordonia sp. CPCC 205515]|uniref:hypothetical protein n=1 Tax=Gordonia sp. CPCC 205515 TaxID=3140791 RepID=UPI003AF33B7C
MSTNRAALATTTVTLSDGRTGHIVGYVEAFPSHPAAGTIAAPIPGTDEPITAAVDVFALVSVQWATEIINVDLHTLEATTTYAEGMLGTPRGTSWYLAPVEPTPNGYATVRGFAASATTAQVPAILGITDARQVESARPPAVVTH